MYSAAVKTNTAAKPSHHFTCKLFSTVFPFLYFAIRSLSYIQQSLYNQLYFLLLLLEEDLATPVRIIFLSLLKLTAFMFLYWLMKPFHNWITQEKQGYFS